MKKWITRKLRNLARWYLVESWKSSLPLRERMLLARWGATGNGDHGPFEWVEWQP